VQCILQSNMLRPNLDLVQHNLTKTTSCNLCVQLHRKAAVFDVCMGDPLSSAPTWQHQLDMNKSRAPSHWIVWECIIPRENPGISISNIKGLGVRRGRRTHKHDRLQETMQASRECAGTGSMLQTCTLLAIKSTNMCSGGGELALTLFLHECL
jgi:hypothetical protein